MCLGPNWMTRSNDYKRRSGKIFLQAKTLILIEWKLYWSGEHLILYLVAEASVSFSVKCLPVWFPKLNACDVEVNWNIGEGNGLLLLWPQLLDAELCHNFLYCFTSFWNLLNVCWYLTFVQCYIYPSHIYSHLSNFTEPKNKLYFIFIQHIVPSVFIVTSALTWNYTILLKVFARLPCVWW